MTYNNVDPKIVEKAISFNVKLRLMAAGKKQADLAKYLGVERSTVTMKLAGKSSWSVADLVNTANFLKISTDTLMNDTLMRQMVDDVETDMKKATSEEVASGQLLRLGLNQRPSVSSLIIVGSFCIRHILTYALFSEPKDSLVNKRV